MIRAIFYKESIKCRAIISLLLLVALGAVIYLYIMCGEMLRLNGAASLWLTTIERGQSIVPAIFKWLLLLAPAAISATQYLAEMTNKRLKLTLHLPRPEGEIISAMQLFGVSASMAVNLLCLLSISIGLRLNFPAEIVGAEILNLLPYTIGGVASYLLTMWIIVEPITKRRIINLVVSAMVISFFTLGTPSLLSYIYALPLLLFITFLAWLSALHSAARFKDGAQS